MTEKLTPRERRVMHCIAVECLSNKETARKLGISKRTVELFRAHLMEKMGARNTAHLVHLVLAKCPHATSISPQPW